MTEVTEESSFLGSLYAAVVAKAAVIMPSSASHQEFVVQWMKDVGFWDLSWATRVALFCIAGFWLWKIGKVMRLWKTPLSFENLPRN